MGYMNSIGVGTSVPSKGNNGVGVLTPLDKCENETEVSTPRVKKNGTKVPAPMKMIGE